MMKTGGSFSGGTKQYGGSKPVWKAIWGKVEGGFVLDESLIVPNKLYAAGTLVAYDTATRKAVVATAIEKGKKYGLIENDLYITDNVTAASVAVVYHGEVIEENIPALPKDAKAVLQMIHFT